MGWLEQVARNCPRIFITATLRFSYAEWAQSSWREALPWTIMSIE